MWALSGAAVFLWAEAMPISNHAHWLGQWAEAVRPVTTGCPGSCWQLDQRLLHLPFCQHNYFPPSATEKLVSVTVYCSMTTFLALVQLHQKTALPSPFCNSLMGRKLSELNKTLLLQLHIAFLWLATDAPNSALTRSGVGII